MHKFWKVNFQKGGDDNKTYNPDNDDDDDDNDDDDIVQLSEGLQQHPAPTTTATEGAGTSGETSHKALDLEVAMHLLVSINLYGSRWQN